MFERIPHELQSDPAWVNVRDNSKLPMQTTKRECASSVDSTTWGTFAQAVENVQTGAYQGIGYVFHDTGLVGIDIDDGYDEDGFLSQLAVDILGHCQSYTEKSRSGRGFHVLVRGDIPFKGRNNRELHVEAYKTARYFIMTGRTLLYTEIIENQGALDYIVSTYFADVVSEEDSEITSRIYNPVFERPKGGKLPLRPTYPVILTGGRNICLTSLAGQLHTQGYSKQAIYRELLHANSVACKPPLPVREVQSIVASVTKNRR